MGKNVHKPLRHTNQSNPKEKSVFKGVIIVLSIIALGLVGLGVYAFIWDKDAWGLSVLAFIVASVPAFWAYLLYKGRQHKDEYEYRFELNEEGIVEEHINHKKDLKEEVHIPFSSVHSVVVGNVAEFIRMSRGSDFYRFDAMMIIKHEDGIHIQRFNELDTLKNWLSRFLDKGRALYKTTEDLFPAIMDSTDYQVDFSKVEGLPWDGKTEFPPVGEERKNNPFQPWKHGADLRPENTKEKKNKTKTWEKRISLLLFLFSFIAGIMVFPQAQLDADDFIKMNGSIFGMIFIALVIPFLFVYWRKYTKWYNPFVHFVLVTTSNTIAMIIVFLIDGDSILENVKIYFSNILLLNIFFLLPGWLILLLATKAIKWIVSFYQSFSNR